MYNHHRTLLLNLPYSEDPEEHIPSEFTGKKLPSDLSYIHKQLFPTTASRHYKIFLVQCYLNLIYATGQESHLLDYDTRVTYDLNSSAYFKINRYSNPALSSASHPIFIRGKYIQNIRNNNFYDNFLISQISNTNNIRVYSTVSEQYLTPTGYVEDIGDATIVLTFDTGGVSQEVKLASTGITVSIARGASFTSTSNKTWEFLVEAPYIFSFNKIFDKLASDPKVSLMLDNTVVDDEFKNLWSLHPNKVYKFAGMLLGFVQRLSTL